MPRLIFFIQLVFSMGVLCPFLVQAENIDIFCEKDICYAVFRDKTYRCAVGRNGIRFNKVEGDKCTPAGTYPLRTMYFRPDRLHSIKTGLTLYQIHQGDAWCTDPKSPEYNKHITVQNTQKCKDLGYELLYREDNLYDGLVVIGYNDDPIIPRRGSAIFLHIARPGYSGTDGCIALALKDFLEVIAKVDSSTTITMHEDGMYSSTVKE